MTRTRAVLVLALPLLLSACSKKGDPGDEPFLNPKPNLVQCRADPGFQTFQFEGWDAGAPSLKVRFLPHATTKCPGRRFPFVDVVASTPLRWVQVVEVNTPIPGGTRAKPSWQLIPEDEPWIFADIVPELRDGGEPFLNASKDGIFWDNPTWPDPPKEGQKDGARKWRSRSYAVTVEERKIRAVAGFGWGWTWTVGAAGPEPVAPAAIDRAAWKIDAARLAMAFPEWSFE